jgi:hypothetical protein
LSHISGYEIAMGDPDHCLELLQILHQLTTMMAEEGGTEGGLTDSKVAGDLTQQSPGDESSNQQQQINLQMGTSGSGVDEYDDEEEEEENQRLSPLHHHMRSQDNGGAKAAALSKEAEGLGNQDYGNEDEEDEDGDYYDELIKRGRKLHSKVEKEDEGDFEEEFSKDEDDKLVKDAQDSKKVPLLVKEPSKEEGDDYEDDFHDDGEESTPSPPPPQKVEAKIAVDKNEVTSSSPEGSKASPAGATKGAKKVDQSDDFRDYYEEDAGDDDYDEEEEEEEVKPPPKKIEFPFMKAAPDTSSNLFNDKPKESLYDFSKKDGDKVQVIGQKSTTFNPPWKKATQPPPTQEPAQKTPIFFGAANEKPVEIP